MLLHRACAQEAHERAPSLPHEAGTPSSYASNRSGARLEEEGGNSIAEHLSGSSGSLEKHSRASERRGRGRRNQCEAVCSAILHCAAVEVDSLTAPREAEFNRLAQLEPEPPDALAIDAPRRSRVQPTRAERAIARVDSLRDVFNQRNGRVAFLPRR